MELCTKNCFFGIMLLVWVSFALLAAIAMFQQLFYMEARKQSILHQRYRTLHGHAIDQPGQMLINVRVRW